MRHALRGTFRPNRKTHPVDDPLPDRHGLPPSENDMWDPVDLILTSTSRSSHNLSVTRYPETTLRGALLAVACTSPLSWQPVYKLASCVLRIVDASPRCKKNCNLSGSTGLNEL